MTHFICKRFALFTLLTLLIGGCGSPASRDNQTDGQGPDSTAEVSSEADDATEPEILLEPFDPPPLAEIEESTEWIDLPVKDGVEILRARQAGSEPLVSEEQALSMRNDSEQTNAEIYSVFNRLPESDDQVDWDATWVHHTSADAKSLNPIMINSSVEMELLELYGLQLIGFDTEFTPHAVKWAVKSWQTSKDHMMDKFVLRDDILWSDGTPLTAHDVAFTFQTTMNPKVPVPAVRSQVAKLRWVHAYDDHTVVMFHKEPMASWTENIQFPIIPKHIYEDSLADDYTMANSDYHLQFEQKPVVCGPYEVADRTRGQEIVLRRREDFFMQNGEQVRPKPFIKEIRYQIIIDPNTTLLALKSGKVDDCRLTAEQWLTQTDGSDFYDRNTKLSGSEWTEFHIEWNCQSEAAPFFSDKRVRRAMAYTLNHEEMIKTIFYDLVEPGTGVFHPDAWMASQNVEPFTQDLDKAEDLLDEAGWVDSDGDGIRDKRINGRLVPFEFTLITYQQPNAIKACTLFKDNLAQIGIVCHVKPTEFTVKTQLAIDHKYQAMMGGWGTGTDPSTLDNIFVSGAGRNFSQYSNPRVDELFEQAQKEFDREKRAALYAEIHEILYEDQPNLWLFHRKSLYGLNKKLRGFNFSPRDPFGVQPGLHGIWVRK